MNLPLIEDAVTRHFDFRDGAKYWFFAVRPKTDWAAALQAIGDELSRPGLDEQYGISTDAAKLLSWIKALPADQYTGPWTPVVEDARDRLIGISSPWSEANFPAYLQMLTDEINERTDYHLTLQPWQHHSQPKTRIRVAKKRSELDEVVRHVQWLGLRRNVAISDRDVRDGIEALINSAERSSH